MDILGAFLNAFEDQFHCLVRQMVLPNSGYTAPIPTDPPKGQTITGEVVSITFKGEDISDLVDGINGPDTKSNFHSYENYHTDCLCTSCKNVRELKAHEALPTTQCNLATTIAGCIYHPSSVHVTHQTCFCVNCDEAVLQTLLKEKSVSYYGNNPIIEKLEDQKRAAEEALEELNNARYEIDDKVSELESFVSDIDDVINSLSDLPEINVEVSIDVRFDSSDV